MPTGVCPWRRANKKFRHRLVLFASAADRFCCCCHCCCCCCCCYCLLLLLSDVVVVVLAVVCVNPLGSRCGEIEYTVVGGVSAHILRTYVKI